MKTSIYKNWRKHETNVKIKELSAAFPIKVFTNSHNCIGLQFENDKNERITFILNEEATKLFLMNLDRFYHKKENVKREDYGLQTL